MQDVTYIYSRFSEVVLPNRCGCTRCACERSNTIFPSKYTIDSIETRPTVAFSGPTVSHTPIGRVYGVPESKPLFTQLVAHTPGGHE